MRGPESGQATSDTTGCDGGKTMSPCLILSETLNLLFPLLGLLRSLIQVSAPPWAHDEQTGIENLACTHVFLALAEALPLS